MIKNSLQLALFFTFAVLVTPFIFPAASAYADDNLKDKIETYWKHRVDKQYTKLYDMENSEYKTKVSLDDYLMRHGSMTKIHDFEIKDIIKLSDEKCKVKVTYFYTINLPIPELKDKMQTGKINDIWIKQDDGQWYHVPKPKDDQIKMAPLNKTPS